MQCAINEPARILCNKRWKHHTLEITSKIKGLDGQNQTKCEKERSKGIICVCDGESMFCLVQSNLSSQYLAEPWTGI
jgi:hypothetical protein